jgi:ABC-2 type transport system permease protein
VFAHIDASPALLHQFNPGITWWGWRVPVALELLLVVIMGVLLLTAAVAQFRRTD